MLTEEFRKKSFWGMLVHRVLGGLGSQSESRMTKKFHCRKAL
jgi:hypothetical protein